MHAIGYPHFNAYHSYTFYRAAVLYISIHRADNFLSNDALDDLDGKERGQKKTDDLRAMTTLGPRTLPVILLLEISILWFGKSWPCSLATGVCAEWSHGMVALDAVITTIFRICT